MLFSKDKTQVSTTPPSKEMNSVIGNGSVFEGKFYISGNIQINGKFEGEIRTNEALIVGETGKIKTDLRAKKVRMAGTMIGNIIADNDVRLEKTGRLLGDITAPAIIIEPGVVAKGNITITGGQKKDVKKVVEESYGTNRLSVDGGYLEKGNTTSKAKPKGK